MSRRTLELVLLLVAAPLIIVEFALLALNQGQELGLTNLGVPLGLFAAFVVAHLATRKLAPNADPALLPLAFALSGTGMCFVTRLAAPEDAVRQVMWLFLGIACMILVMVFMRKLDKLGSYKYTLMLLGVVLLLSPLLPGIGHEEYGSRIWLKIGPMSMQPGEFAKICIVIFLSGYLASNRELLSVFTWQVGPLRLPDIRVLVPLLLMWGLAMIVVILEKDLGSALVFFFVFIFMLYVASGRKAYLAVSLGMAGVAAIVLHTFFGHVQVRVSTWLDPFADAAGTGYQLVQAIFSMADGDLFGVGIGNGLCEQIPVVSSDFIFAAVAEEIGLLGAAGVLLLYLCFAIRGFLTAARAKSDISSLMATGLTTIVVLQAFIIVGGVTRLIPLTGLTLPFMSQGGSSLLASFMIVGFLLRCGDESAEKPKPAQSTTGFLSSNSVLGRVSLGKRLTNTCIAFAILFALLVANLTMIMVVNAREYQNMPNNNHTIAHQQNSQRGSISTFDGVTLAQSVKQDDGTYKRVYPSGNLASHVVGYASTRYGTSGIEATSNDVLEGSQSFATWSDVIDSLTGKGTTGNNVTLTLNSKAQKAAQAALKGETGACVVVDPTTGAVLAMASSPTYDAADYEKLLDAAAKGSNDSSLYNRATQALYAPGSTFKMLTLAAALEENVVREDTTFKAPGSLKIGNAPVNNFGKTDYGKITVARATEVSSNTVYGQLGTLLGAQKLVDYAQTFGFNKATDFDLALAKSLMPDPKEMTEWETAWAAAGEPVGEHPSPAGPQATVLQMALVGCGIANDGVIMRPYLVDSVHNADGQQSYAASAKKLTRAVSPDTAKRVRKVLEGVVKNGTGTGAAVPGIQVAGKTGTAEHENGDDSWFVGMAPSDKSNVVVALVLEKSKDAASKSQKVFRAALEAQGIL
ncbi:MAG: FtsW/RodA/SpoVE family cell cycle protein [Coriobacteriia bacterium]|nr:FtsW/RodA/SpoVE family cell cycle protein [Coriobacteriia bacterium]